MSGGSERAEETMEVLRRRREEALAAGLTVVEAGLFAASDQDIGVLRQLVRDGCSPELIALIVV